MARKVGENQKNIVDSVKSWWESRNGGIVVKEGIYEKEEGLTSLAKSKNKGMSDMIDRAGYKIVKGFILTFAWLMQVASLPGILLRFEKVIV